MKISFIEAAFYATIFLFLYNNDVSRIFLLTEESKVENCLSYTIICVNVYGCVYAYDHYF